MRIYNLNPNPLRETDDFPVPAVGEILGDYVARLLAYVRENVSPTASLYDTEATAEPVNQDSTQEATESRTETYHVRLTCESSSGSTCEVDQVITIPSECFHSPVMLMAEIVNDAMASIVGARTIL